MKLYFFTQYMRAVYGDKLTQTKESMLSSNLDVTKKVPFTALFYYIDNKSSSNVNDKSNVNE